MTVDFDTLEDNAVTVRERDSMKQERVSLDQIESYLAQPLVGAGSPPTVRSASAPGRNP